MRKIFSGSPRMFLVGPKQKQHLEKYQDTHGRHSRSFVRRAPPAVCPSRRTTRRSRANCKMRQVRKRIRCQLWRDPCLRAFSRHCVTPINPHNIGADGVYNSQKSPLFNSSHLLEVDPMAIGPDHFEIAFYQTPTDDSGKQYRRSFYS
jgi:hypothetical protein